MPKAGPSNPRSSPTKSSPTKPTYRKKLIGDFSVPLGTSSTRPSSPAFPRSRVKPQDPDYGRAANGKNIRVYDNLPRHTAGPSVEPLWIADDIFLSKDSSRTVSPEPTLKSQEYSPDTAAQQDFPTMFDVETALDKAVIEKGLDQLPTEQHNNDSSLDAPTDSQKPILRTEYLPFFCSGKELWQQLLEADIYPATHKRPRTGFTMEVLRHQRSFNFRSKTTLKEYYDALVDLSSATEDKGSVPSIYDPLRTVRKEKRVLDMHMRAGRPSASAPLRRGELCVICPTCPQPGVNLPTNWERDKLKQLRYVRFLAGDGNFKLQHLSKRAQSTSDNQKSLLGDGGFWVPDDDIKRYLNATSEAADEPKGRRRSACNTMAGDPGYSPEGAKAYDITGVFCVSCRHIFICPNGVIDLHKGENPLNESYAAGLRYFVITYDIACKYKINFKSRCCDKNCNFVLIPTPGGDINIIFCINKFHQESHDEDCAAKNALDYTKYVGRTCGEGVETVWAKMNWLRYSTREMSIGTRVETLSEHFNDWNWQKTLSISECLFSRLPADADASEARHLTTSYRRAVEALDTVIEELKDLEMSVGSQAAASLRAQYEKAGGEQFLADSTQLQWLSRKDLFASIQELTSTSKTLETASPSAGNDVAQINFICNALKLEAMQAKLCQRAFDLASIRDPTKTLVERVRSLKTEVSEGLKQHYELLIELAPQLEPLFRALDSPATDEVLLPSRLEPEEVIRYGLTSLFQTEIQLRICYAHDLINELRKALSLQSFWARHVEAQHSSQTIGTKGQSHLQAAESHAREASQAYQSCFKWLAKMSPKAGQKWGLRSLENGDLTLLNTWKDRKAYKRPNSRLPWIWRVRPMQALDGGTDPLEMDSVTKRRTTINPLEDVIEKWRNEFVRLDFVHTLAAVERWTEEIHILAREMAATSRYFRNAASVWASRANDRASSYVEHETRKAADKNCLITSFEVRGYIAYASRQFDLYARLATDSLQAFSQAVGPSAWEDIWHSPQDHDLVPEPAPAP
ncbi:hypothetical protein FS837_011950 [Tulasnella sp. UAMH 9824]|nr:hypothetical protein FS837_011950 [Tulasnella sp. UAMH 9824]